MAGVVFDTSGLLALEAENLRAKMIVRECRRRNETPLLPSAVVAEWCPVDAIVAAVAARVGATVITQDEGDFMRLRGFFPDLKFRRP